MFGKQKVATLVAEFLGTGILTFMILSIQRSTIGVPFFVAAGAGLALAVATYALRETSGAHFNPALTIGLWTARKVTTVAALVYVVVQLLGGWAAYGLYTYLVKNSFQPIGGHYTTRVLIAEAVGTAVFTFCVTATVYRRFTRESAAAYAGVAYMTGIIIASPVSLGLLNPAVALGVRAWVWGTYVAGPVIGAVVGVNLYDLLFAAEGEATNVLTARTARPAPAAASRTTASRPAAKKKATRRK